MKTYKPNKALKISMIVVGLLPFAIGILCLFGIFNEKQISVQFTLLLIAIVFFFFFILIINRSFTNISIDGDNIILKNPFFPKKTHNIKELTEIAMFDYQNKQPETSLLGGTAQAIGRGIGLGLLAYAKRAPKNCTFEKQFMAKYGDNKVFSIVTNFIDDLNQLVAEIKAIAGVEFIHVTLSTYKEWRLKK